MNSGDDSLRGGDAPETPPSGGSNLSWQPGPALGGSDQGWVPPSPPTPEGSSGFSDPGWNPRPGGLPKGHPGRRVAAAVAAVAVLGAVGLGGYELGNNRGGTPQTASQAIPSPSAGSGSRRPSAINASKLAAKVDPSVVDVTWTYNGSTSSGTGIILTSNGEVLTNNHVVAGSVQLSVQVAGSGPKYQAEVVGVDVTQDVALIQIQGGSGFHPASIGNSGDLKVGERVVAIGNALALPGPPTVTQGAITALDRSITASDQGSGLSENLTNMVQIDAPLEPGNSGGPLVDASGHVIAMNTAAETNGRTASTVGFSIPINRALSIASQIQKGESSSTIQIGPTAFLGIEAQNVPSPGAGGFGGYGYTPPVSSGALVTAVVPNTPAAGAGMAAGDVITSFNGKAVKSVGDLTTDIHGDKPGQSATFGWVDASGGSHTATVTLTAGPAA